MPSTIFMSEEIDCTPKLVKFIILLSELRSEEAFRMLAEFNHYSYYNHLDKLLQHLQLTIALQNQIVRFRGSVMRLKAEVTRLNDVLVQERLKQRPASMTDEQLHKIEVVAYLEGDELGRGYGLAQVYKMDRMAKLIQEVQEYRWLKDEMLRSGSTQSRSLRFQSSEGEALKRLVNENSSRYNQTIAFFKQELHNITQNLPLTQLPPHLFDQEFKQEFEAFITKLRVIKSNFQEFQRPIKQKIVSFSNRRRIEINPLLGVNETFDSFLEKVEEILDKSQQKIFFKRSISSVSDFISSESEGESSMNQPSKIQVPFPFPRGKPRASLSKIQLEPKLEEMNKILSLHLPAIPNFTRLPSLRKLEELVKKVKQLGEEMEKVKLNDELFAKSIRVDDDMLRQFHDKNIADYEEPVLALINRKSSEELTIKDLQTIADSLARELQEERAERIKREEVNSNLLIKLKSYPVKQNSTFLDLSSSAKSNCKNAIANLQREIEIHQEMISKLKQDLTQKQTIINNMEMSRVEDRKKFEKEKQAIVDQEKAKLHKMREEYDDLMDQVSKLNNLYEERFIITQKGFDPTQSSFMGRGEEKSRMKQQLQRLSFENQQLKQQLSGKTTHELGIAVSKSLSFSDKSDSFIDKLNLESKILVPSNTHEYEDRISELEFKNELLLNQLENKDTFYNTYIDSQARECSKFKELAASLEREKEQLSSRLQLMEVRSVVYRPENLPTLHLFPSGFIFEDYDYQERLFLLQNLQSYTGPIRKTRLLYRADPHNRVNFHKYIDKHRHVVTIFKTIYGRLIAGYSEEAFDASGIVRGYGMILSLWGRKVFELREKKAISYDDYFLIFGNSQLRIKSGEFRLFSNFGIVNGYYNNRGQKVHSILGEDKQREVELSHFEVYTLDLEQ